MSVRASMTYGDSAPGRFARRRPDAKGSDRHSHYDVAVIGTGPAGRKAAINAARMGKRVVAIEREPSVGGVCIRTGTVPSKAMR